MKKDPVRMCIACRAGKPKKEMIRIVNCPEIGAFVDYTGKTAGRGAYICKETSCIERAYKTKALSRAIGCPMTEELLEKLRGDIGH